MISNNIEDFTPCESRPDFHAVMTIQLVELTFDGLFDWNAKPLQGCFDALNDLDASIAPRLKQMFIERNQWREISIVPYLQWAQQLAYTIKYELVPKYEPMYRAIMNGDFDPLHISDEYYKERIVDSAFPETLLSGNSDYLSAGHDREYEKIDSGDAIDLALRYYERYYAIDEAFMNELDVFFIDLWSVNENVL